MKSLGNKVVAIALVLATGTLLAQPAPDAAPAADAEVTTELDLKLTPAEMTSRVRSFATQIDEDIRIVIVLQRNARKEKDVIKLSCINDKLLQIKALRNIFDDGKIKFEASTEGESRSEFSQVAGAATNIRQLREQARVCAGEGELQSDADNEFQGPDIPDDPSADLFPDDDYVEPPGFASPFD